ncbi:hypothetical protein BD289DRAFT_431172 [Coniella lustricola]|uniref:Uncharacterized protein n=1 Tax=Coniella lustricola TaxID=2025994 RepID=A0A2T3AB45_9PEZI|nr:hypothetical protein BD289DRAFT_431172 [Coniella lustricola]
MASQTSKSAVFKTCSVSVPLSTTTPMPLASLDLYRLPISIAKHTLRLSLPGLVSGVRSAPLPRRSPLLLSMPWRTSSETRPRRLTRPLTLLALVSGARLAQLLKRLHLSPSAPWRTSSAARLLPRPMVLPWRSAPLRSCMTSSLLRARSCRLLSTLSKSI